MTPPHLCYMEHKYKERPPHHPQLASRPQLCLDPPTHTHFGLDTENVKSPTLRPRRRFKEKQLVMLMMMIESNTV